MLFVAIDTYNGVTIIMSCREAPLRVSLLSLDYINEKIIPIIIISLAFIFKIDAINTIIYEIFVGHCM